MESSRKVSVNTMGKIFTVYTKLELDIVCKRLETIVPFTGDMRVLSNDFQISDPVTEYLIKDSVLSEGVRLMQDRLGDMPSGVLRYDYSTYYQNELTPLRDVLSGFLVSAQVNAVRIFGKPLKLLLGDELKEIPDYGKVLTVIKTFTDLQKEMWSRGVVDVDPKILDNYGAVIDERGNCMIGILGFSHISGRRSDYYSFSVGPLGVMKFYKQLNAMALDQIGADHGVVARLGDFYREHAADNSSFEKCWPKGKDPIHLEKVRRQRPVLDKRITALYAQLGKSGSVSQSIDSSLFVAEIGCKKEPSFLITVKRAITRNLKKCWEKIIGGRSKRGRAPFDVKKHIAAEARYVQKMMKRGVDLNRNEKERKNYKQQLMLLIEKIGHSLSGGKVVVIIDGDSGSGKSFMGAKLAEFFSEQGVVAIHEDMDKHGKCPRQQC